MQVKRTIYLTAFTFLGFLVSMLAHAVLEIGVIALLEKDFAKFSLGLTWGQLMLVHHVFSIILLVVGLVFGFRQGVYWWDKLYGSKSA